MSASPAAPPRALLASILSPPARPLLACLLLLLLCLSVLPSSSPLGRSSRRPRPSLPGPQRRGCTLGNPRRAVCRASLRHHGAAGVLADPAWVWQL